MGSTGVGEGREGIWNRADVVAVGVEAGVGELDAGVGVVEVEEDGVDFIVVEEEGVGCYFRVVGVFEAVAGEGSVER
jgi:hypothetical protein